MNKFHSSVELKNVSGVLAHAMKVSVGSKMTLDLTEEKKNVKKKKKTLRDFFKYLMLCSTEVRTFIFGSTIPYEPKKMLCAKNYFI